MPERERERLKFIAEYHHQRPQLERLLAQLMAFLEELRRSSYPDPVHRIHSVRGRVKDAESLWRKWQDKVLDASDEKALDARPRRGASGAEIYALMTQRFSDIIGLRVVCNTLAGKHQVCRDLQARGPQLLDITTPRLFATLESSDKFYRDSGYRSVHFDTTVEARNWPALAVESSDNDAKIMIEIQVRTILEEAWGEIEHDLMYKGGTGLKRKPKALFLALSHRLHEADLNVQRLTTKVDRGKERRRSKPSVQQSIPTDAGRLPASEERFRVPLGKHLDRVENLRRTLRFEAAIAAHQRLLRDLDSDASLVRALVCAELGYDHLRCAEGELARGRDGRRHLKLAERHYGMALKGLGEDAVVLWRRARVLRLEGDDKGARSDLEQAIEIVPKAQSRFSRERFYPACLYRSLTQLLWSQGESLALTNRARSQALKQLAYEKARTALSIQKQEFSNEAPPSEACALHYCDVLNNMAWLSLAYKHDLAAAQRHITTIEEEIRPALWEHNVFLLGTRLRLKVSVLESKRRDGSDLDISDMVEADALRTQLFHALTDRDEYVPRRAFKSMLDTVTRLEKVWKSFLSPARPAPGAK